MGMVRKHFQILTLAAVLCVAAPNSTAGLIVGAVEDTQGSSGTEKNGDFNDIIFQLAGTVNIDAPGADFTNLTSAWVNQNGTVFWDNVSGDGPNMNIGYCLLGVATCGPSSLAGQYQYIAMPGGSAEDYVYFDAVNSVTLTVTGGITGNKGNVLGWYNLEDPNTLYPLFAVPSGTSGETASFTPNGPFALFSSDGWGQVYTSVSPSNQKESPDQQHFAFFVDPPSSTSVPESSSATMLGMGLGMLGLGIFLRRSGDGRPGKRQF